MKKYKITKELIEKLRPLYLDYCRLELEHSRSIIKLQKKMCKVTGIKNIEMCFDPTSDNFMGIGNRSRTMELIQSDDFNV